MKKPPKKKPKKVKKWEYDRGAAKKPKKKKY
jgi:hypothetical protein